MGDYAGVVAEAEAEEAAAAAAVVEAEPRIANGTSGVVVAAAVAEGEAPSGAQVAGTSGGNDAGGSAGDAAAGAVAADVRTGAQEVEGAGADGATAAAASAVTDARGATPVGDARGRPTSPRPGVVVHPTWWSTGGKSFLFFIFGHGSVRAIILPKILKKTRGTTRDGIMQKNVHGTMTKICQPRC